MSRWQLVLVLLLGACAPRMSSWDPLAVAPARPELPAGADSNSALAYHALGVSRLRADPTTAAAAFYWASRLDPSWADPLYGRRVALLMRKPDLFFAYADAESPLHESPGVLALDSLLGRAHELNPFLEPSLDLVALDHVVHQELRQHSAGLMESESEWVVRDWLTEQDPETRAWFAYADRQYGWALELYGMALRRGRNKVSVQANTARVLFRLGRYDEAREAMHAAIETMRSREATELVRVYESKARFEHFIGLVHETQGDTVAAREAYARALEEDLSYHPAHMRLGELSLAAGDSAAALGELALATQLRESDPAVRFRYALLLIQMRRFAEAEPELRRAIELEPLYADPYRLLAVALDFQGQVAEAAETYRAFLAHASQGAPGRDAVTRRISQMQATPPAGSAP